MADGSTNPTRKLHYSDRLQELRLLTRSNFLSIFAVIVTGPADGMFRRGISSISQKSGADKRGTRRILDDMAVRGFVAVSYTGEGYRSPIHITVTPEGRAFRAEAMALLFPEATGP